MTTGDSINGSGELLTNLLHFGRLLRGLGLKVSSTQITELAQSLTHFDFTQRTYFYYASRAYLVTAPEQIPLFDQAFDLFWAGRQTWMLQFGMTRQVRESTQIPLEESRIKSPGSRETPHSADDTAPENDDADLQVDAAYSAIEVLRHRDFEAFSDEELKLAKAFIRSLRWHIQERLTRRFQHTSRQARQIDLPRTIRGSMHYGGEIIKLNWKRRKTKPRPLVVICDISGSMDRYSRLFLHFIHTMTSVINHIEAFVFGTRL
ncbi:MAG TPA: VWA domain-containing protein, partial [Aggregatilineales bacterium]|nr:VWA domain-containing protein [Aggregatilineales bacterium]